MRAPIWIAVAGTVILAEGCAATSPSSTTKATRPEAVVIDFYARDQVSAKCSGTLLAQNVVLTSAHCVDGSTGARVHAPDAGGKTARVGKVLTYDWITGDPKMDPSTRNDIALLVLRDPIRIAHYPKIQRQIWLGRTVALSGRVAGRDEVKVGAPMRTAALPPAGRPLDLFVAHGVRNAGGAAYRVRLGKIDNIVGVVSGHGMSSGGGYIAQFSDPEVQEWIRTVVGGASRSSHATTQPGSHAMDEGDPETTDDTQLDTSAGGDYEDPISTDDDTNAGSGGDTGSGGDDGTGGDAGAGDQSGSGGDPGAGDQTGSGGDDPGTGGDPGAAGDPGAGDQTGSGGDPGAGDQTGSGGDPAAGDQTGSGGDPAAGDQTGSGGEPGTGGEPGANETPVAPTKPENVENPEEKPEGALSANDSKDFAYKSPSGMTVVVREGVNTKTNCDADSTCSVTSFKSTDILASAAADKACSAINSAGAGCFAAHGNVNLLTTDAFGTNLAAVQKLYANSPNGEVVLIACDAGASRDIPCPDGNGMCKDQNVAGKFASDAGGAPEKTYGCSGYVWPYQPGYGNNICAGEWTNGNGEKVSDETRSRLGLQNCQPSTYLFFIPSYKNCN